MTTTDLADDAIEIFTKLDLTSVALLFDVDGTLIDIGPTPTEVDVPPALLHALDALARKTNHALALVSGRPIADLDRLFAPLDLSMIGGHGAESRIGGRVVSSASPLPDDLRRSIRDAVGAGVLIEDKAYSVAVHFRAVRDRAREIRHAVMSAASAFPDQNLEVLGGKDMLELKRRGIDKGSAVQALMAHAPFRGRRPVFIGDDITDEAVFAILPRLNGLGFSVGRSLEGLAATFASPSDVRTALARLAEGAAAP